MLIGPPIPEIQLFQDLTMKIQGQAHGWGQSSKSQYESSIPSTRISLVPCQSALLFMRYSIFKVWPWKSKDKVTAQGHKVGITLSTHIPFVYRTSYSWDTAISKSDVENSRSRSEVKFESYNMGPTFVRLTSLRFMSIGHPIPELRLFQNLTFKMKGQGHGWGHSSKSQCGSNILSAHIPYVPCQSGIPFLSYNFFKIWPRKSRAKVIGEITVQSHSVGLTSYRLIPFTPCQPALPFLKYSIFQIWPWKSRVKVKWAWRCTTVGLDNSIELQMV